MSKIFGQSNDLTADESRPLRVLRIAHASLTPALRGRERAIAQKYPEIDLRVITPDKWRETGVDIEAVPDEYFPVITARTFLSSHIQAFLYNPFPIIRELRNFQPDVIDMDHEPYSLPCAEIVTLRNLFSPSAKIVMQTAQNIFKKYPLPFRTFERRAFREVSAAYMCSETVRDVLKRKGFKGPSTVAPFGIDPDLFWPQRKPGERLNGRPVIGFVGRLIEGKGIMTLISALESIQQKNWELLVVGDGPQKKSAESRLRNAGLQERITFTGAIKYEATPEQFSKMDMLVFPTRTTGKIREQFGRVIIEAMACGVPVIGSTCGAIPEVVGDAGLIFEESDHRELAAKISSLIDNPVLCSEIATKGIERVQNEFTWGHAAEIIVSTYLAALATPDSVDAAHTGDSGPKTKAAAHFGMTRSVEGD